jgi:cytoskeletal protein CcmA (bactofilin family)
LIEDRQRELEEDQDDGEPLEGDTIEMRSQAAPPRDGSHAASQDEHDDDVESVTLLGLRGSAPAAPALYADEDDEEEPAAVSSFAPEAPAYTSLEDHEAYSPPQREYGGYSAPVDERPLSSVVPPPMPVPDLGRVGTSGSLVAAEATWEGTLRSDGDIRVEGILRGEVQTAATLMVSPHARIHGTVHARNIMLAGDLEGDVTCEERLEILPGGSARGQINSGTLVVHEGAYIDSRFQMRRDQATPAG